MREATTSATAVNFISVIEPAQGLYLLLLPDLSLFAVSHPYLKAGITKREEIPGSSLFEVFPDNPEGPKCPENLFYSCRVKKWQSEKKIFKKALLTWQGMEGRTGDIPVMGIKI